MNLQEILQLNTGASWETIERIIRNAPRRYKVYQIPKRNNRGFRTIAHPARELKILQRIVLTEILDPLPVSEIAMAYVHGRGILKNAEQHKNSRWILKLDFQNFFHSIVPNDWDRAVKRTPDLEKLRTSADDFHRLLFWGNGTPHPVCLSIGAPTSPSVSNLVCSKLDEWLLEEATEKGLIVPRYADDITVSGPSVPQLRKFEKRLATRLEQNRGIKLRLNEDKRGLYGPGERRMVTGLVITPDGEISIGRDRKREIHSLVYSFKNKETSIEEKLKIKGLIAFVNSVEPGFYRSLNAKYGAKTIREIKHFDPEE